MTLFCLNSTAQSPLGWEGSQLSLSSGYTMTGIPVFAAFEVGLHEDITLGLEGSFRSYNNEKDGIEYAHTISGFGFYSHYYFNNLLRMKRSWYVYGGLGLGFYKWYSPEGYFDVGQSSSRLGADVRIGGRRYWKSWGVGLEVIAGNELIGAKLGVQYRLEY